MAASDQHYRSQKTLDLVFGVSCALMLLSTLWMLVQDFSRDFKGVQRQFRDVESTLAERDMVDKLPDAAKVDQGLHAVRLARLAVALAKGPAVQRDLSAQQTKFDDLKKFRLDELDKDNRAKLDRRLAALEADPALAAAATDFLAAQRKIQGQREQADETYRGYKASFDAESSYYNIAADDAGKEPATGGRRDALLKQAEAIKAKLAKLEEQLATWKGKLDGLDYDSRVLNGPVAAADKALADREDELKKLNTTFDRYAKLAAQKSWGVGDTVRALPILDGFASPTKINQIYLPDLTIDYGGFRDVPRYDRCTTCHLGIDRATFDKAMLGKLGDDDESKRLTAKLQSAKDQLDKRVAAGEKLGYSTSELPGERQGNVGLITVLMLLSALVAAGALGALERSWRVGLNTLFVGLGLTAATSGAMAFLAPVVPKVKAIKLSDGQVTQYCAHPRLDLFVDSNSAHPAEKFGCTSCHAGQGSATEFKLANHMPNDAPQEHHWKKDYAWASSHYWDFPMLPRRFVESSCLKCHHQVTDLITKGVKEEAPKLLKGYNIIREVGCFGCHEIQGMKGGKAVGPDMRLESAPALDLLTAADQEKAKSDPASPPGTLRKVGPSLRRLSEKVSEEWTRKWVLDPRGFRDDTKMPHFYGLSTNSPDVLPDDQKAFPRAEIAAISHYLIAESKNSLQGADFYRDALTKGRNNIGSLQDQLAKGGLSDKDLKDLFDVSRRFSDLALLSNPMASRVINAHALHQRQLQERLGEIQRRLGDMRTRGMGDEALKPVLGEMAAPAKELADVTAALSKAAVAVKLSDRVIDGDGNPATLPADGKGDEVKGRLLFTEKGCLACHAHEGTTKVMKKDGATVVYSAPSDANFGPELSRIAEKLAPAADKTTARAWLVQWIINPNVYHPRTKMPITHLTAEQANDIATWLLAHKPTTPYEVKDPGAPALRELVDLARVYLAKAPGVTRKDLDEYLPAGDKLPGIPADRVATMARDAEERVLAKDSISESSLKWYVGKKAVNRLGCYGCHDIPGFETAKP
ncbi:MAG: c-type cytochrome, partial [Gemmataceae bacterium]